MDILGVETSNIGGLSDGNIEFPRRQVIAIAGPNGTGKSKLLACLLMPWTHSMPSPREPDRAATVSVTLKFNDAELDVLQAFDREIGGNQGRPPAQVKITSELKPLTGLNMTIEPYLTTVMQFASRAELLKRQPSLNLVYLPAERRLLAPRRTEVDLSQLAVELGLSKLEEARGAASQGRLDDAEFESYAKALCVAAFLPSEDGVPDTAAAADWHSFKSSVDTILHPKALEPLSRQRPSELRIRLLDGSHHGVQDLSSGERQALVILSRVFRAGDGHSLIAIDEPDAYLHPALSARLLQSLLPGLGDEGKLFLATHSPSILDGLPPDAILQLSHDAPPRFVESESGRLSLYREAGFRVSALTQAELLVVTEGDFDAVVLTQLAPTLGAASFNAVGGRSQVLKTVTALSSYDLPILGVVDADVLADAPNNELVYVWPAADIEGVLLKDASFLASAIEGKLLRASHANLERLSEILEQLLVAKHDEAVAEYAQRLLRRDLGIKWPSPRGEDPLTRLRALADLWPAADHDKIEAAISEAEEKWQSALPTPWTMVRGKWIAGDFTSSTTEFKTTDGFFNAVLARRPTVRAVADFVAFTEAQVASK